MAFWARRLTYVVVRGAHLLGLLLVVGRELLPREIMGDTARLLAAALLMGAAVWLLRGPLQAAAGDGFGGLGLTVGAGMGIYVAAALLFGAITREEIDAGVRLARRRLSWKR